MEDLATRYGPWAIVAGASEGIGAAFARRLAAAGTNVFLVARRAGPLEELAAELNDRHGVDAVALALDLSRSGAERDLFAATTAHEVGLLVYNAGADEHNVPFLDGSPEDWAAMVRRNCTVPLLASHHYLGPMVARRRGGVILVTSGAAWAGGAGLATYGATKAFDLILAESLWAECREAAVDVLALVVGPTDTPAFQRSLARHGITQRPGLADPDEVARVGLNHLPD